MTFSFKYQDMPRRPNPMVGINPLDRGSGRTVNLQDRVDTLNKSAAWKNNIKAWKQQNKLFDLTRLPKVSMEKLGVLTLTKTSSVS
jgi:hypothetical protein